LLQACGYKNKIDPIYYCKKLKFSCIQNNKVVYLYDELKEDYDRQGFSDYSEELLTSYKNAFNLFESEFEI